MIIILKKNLKLLHNLLALSPNPARPLSSGIEYLNNVIPINKEGNLALVSLSNNIHHNLALENYLAENVNLKNRSILLIWKSDKAVVYGRHQNPWTECNLKVAEQASVKLARRYTGGGCVYHDLGNLNISFIVNRFKYDRALNLSIIKQALDNLKLKNNFTIELSPRHDIFIKEKTYTTDDSFNSYKISGTASRLAKDYSYHHCTLLFESNLTNMQFLKSPIIQDITTRATPSVRSKCLNLRDVIDEPGFDIDRLVQMVCEEYWRSHSTNWSIDHLFNYVDPVCLSGLYSSSLEELESWKFRFATTPKFQLAIDLEMIKLSLTIQNGAISKYEAVNASDGMEVELSNSFTIGLDRLVGVRLKIDDLNHVFEEFKLLEMDKRFDLILNYFNKNIS